MAGRPRLTHCKNGHEIAVLGRYPNGVCRGCRVSDPTKPYRIGNAKWEVCKRGHALAGNRRVDSSGRDRGCLTCYRARESAYKVKRRKHPERVAVVKKSKPPQLKRVVGRISAKPILELLERNGLTIKGFGPLYARVTGAQPETGARMLWRAQQSGLISIDLADTACVAMGLHPVEVYGQDWFTYGAKEVADAV